MEKLAELLNKFENERRMSYRYYYIVGGKYLMYKRDDGEEVDDKRTDLEIISKMYGFIQRLVEQDKIELEVGPLYGCQLIMHNRQPYTLYETLLMLLSISDTPIEDLLLYLK